MKDIYKTDPFKVLKKNQIQLVILCLFPVSIVIGPLVAEIFILIFNVIFLYAIIKKKEFYFFKNQIFIFLFFFYLYLIICLFISDIFFKEFINVLSYIRFPIFGLAVFYFIKENSKYLKYIFLSLMVTICLVAIDGLFQFFFDKNSLGFPKYRPDRISGFFNDDLVLGSFLYRILPVFICLSFYCYKNKILGIISFLSVLISVTVIFLTGERASFLLTIIFLSLLFFSINISRKKKLFFTLITFFSIVLLYKFNPILIDRYSSQLKNHIYNSSTGELFPEHSPMLISSIKMFKYNKLFGVGPKGYRYYCSDEKYISFYEDKDVIIDNTVLKFERSWKEIRDIKINKFYVKVGDRINKDQTIFDYKYFGSDKLIEYKSNKTGIVRDIIIKDKYIGNEKIFELIPINQPDRIFKKLSSCNTHPHNFYFQVLAETGVVGFCFLILIFLIISYKFIRIVLTNLFRFNFEKNISNAEITLIAGFLIYLWPVTTTGNFFNNWVNFLNYYPLGFYFYLKYVSTSNK